MKPKQINYVSGTSFKLLCVIFNVYALIMSESNYIYLAPAWIRGYIMLLLAMALRLAERTLFNHREALSEKLQDSPGFSGCP